MVTLDQIQKKMQSLHEIDSNRFFVEADGLTLDAALESAAVQLGVKVSKVDYEIMQRGAHGLLTLFPRDWKIRAYAMLSADGSVDSGLDDESKLDTEMEQVEIDQDGLAFVFCASDGVYIKVTPPQGKGKAATITDVIEKIRDRNLPMPAEEKLQAIVSAAKAEYEYVGIYERKFQNDATLSVNIMDQEMKAYLFVLPPGEGGADVSADMIIAFLKNNRVIEGIREDLAKDFQDSPVYRENYLIAEGIPPKNGDDAKIVYNFEPDNTKVRLEESKSGKINFKELNLIQNVVEGQPLAQKMPAQRGKAGKTVTGKYLEASSGKDIPIPVGKNARIAEDGMTVVAEVNGQVLLNNNKICVEPIFTVDSVSVKTGNIKFLGTVIVNGNVDDGFEIKASGNIEIKGTVGQAELDAEGDIVVGQGVIGKEGGVIRAGKSIWSKFIQNTDIVEAGDMVIVSDGIINSNVSAKRKVICRGKRADIIGSKVSATETVYARNLGSATSGHDTIISVGFDPQKKARLNMLHTQYSADAKTLADVKLNVNSLESIQADRGSLPEDKQTIYKSLTEQKYMLEMKMKEVECEIEEIKEYLQSLRAEGRISASGNVYAGVQISIWDVIEDIRVDCQATTFFLERGLIRYGKLDTEDEEAARMPSGYSTN